MDLPKLNKPPSALISHDYTKGAGGVTLAVDVRLDGWGGVLIKEKRHPSGSCTVGGGIAQVSHMVNTAPGRV